MPGMVVAAASWLGGCVALDGALGVGDADGAVAAGRLPDLAPAAERTVEGTITGLTTPGEPTGVSVQAARCGLGTEGRWQLRIETTRTVPESTGDGVWIDLELTSGPSAAAGLQEGELVVRQDGVEGYRLRGPLELRDRGLSAEFRGGGPEATTVDVTCG